MIHLLIVDDHTIVREGVRNLIKGSIQNIEIDEASNIKEAITSIKNKSYNLILLDYQLQDGFGTDLIQFIKNNDNPPKVLILTAHEDENIIMQCIQLGVSGILIKTSEIKRIIEGIQSVISGGNYYDPLIMHKIVCYVSSRENNLKLLNDNECEILKNLAKGMSNREISNEMHMSEKTIRNYLSIIYEKIKVKNRTEAVLYYQKNIK